MPPLSYLNIELKIYSTEFIYSQQILLYEKIVYVQNISVSVWQA